MTEGISSATTPYRWWLIFFAGVAIAAAGFFFSFHQLRKLAYYPQRSAISGWDNSFYFFWLRSPLWGGELDFADDVRDCPTLAPAGRELALAQPRTKLGRMQNKYGVGWAVASAPFYVLGDAFLHAWRGAFPNSSLREDGVGPAYQIAVLLGQFALGVASLCLAVSILLRWFSREASLLGVLVTWLGSFLFYYQTSDLSMAHNVVFFGLTACYASALSLARTPERLAPWIYCGASAGLMVITRYQTVLYLLYPVVLALLTAPSIGRPGRLLRWSQWFSRAGIATACFAGVVFIQLYAWASVYGSWLVDSYAGERFEFGSPHLWAVLFSPRHGLFYWSPLLALSAAGFIGWLFSGPESWWRRPEICWIASLVATIYLNAAWSCWWFGASFGARAFEGCLLFFMAGTACMLEQFGRSRWRHALLGAATLLIAANLTLAHAFRRNWIAVEDPMTHAQMWQGVRRGFGGGK